MFKLDGNNIFNKAIMIEISIFFNSNLGSKRAPTKPFCFQMPLNFATKENCNQFTITFDGNEVESKV